MDDILQDSLREIGLEGLRGCTANTLWSLLGIVHDSDKDVDEEEENNNHQRNTVDANAQLKQKIWDMLKLSHGGEITFFSTTNNDDESHQSSADTVQYTEEGFMIGNKVSNRRELTYNELKEALYNDDSIVMVANSAMRSHLLGLGFRTDTALSEIQYCVLEYLGQCRAKGAFQAAIAKDLFIDNRSTQYHLKRLFGVELITREQKYDPKLKTFGNLIHLTKFSPTSNPHYQNVESAEERANREEYEEFHKVKENIVPLVTDLLKNAKNNILIEVEVRKTLVKIPDATKAKHRWDRLKQILGNSGKVEFLKAYVENKLMNCMRLKEDGSSSATDEQSDETKNTPGFYAEIPQIYQVYELIANSGEKGLKHTDIFNYFRIDAKVSHSMCGELKKDYGVSALAQKIDKQTIYIYSAPNSDRVLMHDPLPDLQAGPAKKKMEKIISVVPEQPLIISEPTRLSVPKGKKPGPPKGSKLKRSPKSASESPVAEESEQTSDDDIEASVDIIDLSHSAIPASQNPSDRTSTPLRKGLVVTKQMAERCQIILDYVNEHSICTKFQLTDLLKQHAEQCHEKAKQEGHVKQTAKTPMLDRKTITRAIEVLEKEQKIKTFFVTVPALFGTSSKEYTCILKPDIDLSSEIVQNFVKNLKEEDVTISRRKANDDVRVEKVKVEHLDEFKEQKKISETDALARKERVGLMYAKVVYNSIKNGYINAKMVRVKNFHFYLWKYHLEHEENTANNEDRLTGAYKLSDLLANMPLLLFLRIVGCLGDVDFDEYKKGDPDLLTKPIKSLHPSLQKELITKENLRQAYVTRILFFLKLLQKLGLLEVPGNTSNAGELKDYGLDSFQQFKLVSRPTFVDPDHSTSTFNFTTIDDVSEYWKDLEFYSIHTLEDLAENEVEYEEDVKEPEQNNKKKRRRQKKHKATLRRLPELRKSNWVEMRYFTVNQLRVLEEFQKKLKEDEKPSHADCFKLAKLTKSSLDQVVLYFFRYREKILSARLHTTTEFQVTKNLFKSSTKKQRKDKPKKSITKEKVHKSKRRTGKTLSSIFNLDEQEDAMEDENEESVSSEEAEESDSEAEDADEVLQELIHSSDESSDESGEDEDEEPKTSKDAPLSLFQYASQNRLPTLKKPKKKKVKAQASVHPSHVDAFVKQKKFKKRERERIQEQEKQAPKRPVKKHFWKPEEDLQLLEAIAREREVDPATGKLVIKPVNWQKVAEGVPGMNNEQCRRRWSAVLRLLPWCRRAVEVACAHKQLNNDINNEISLRSILMSCRDEHNAGGSSNTLEIEHSMLGKIDRALPASIELLHQHFTILKIYESEKYAKSSLTIQDEVMKDVESNVKKGTIKEAVLTDLLRIILLTPEEDYDVKAAYTLVKRFDTIEIENALQHLKKLKVVSKNKHRGFRMRGIRLNHNFVDRCTISHFPKETFSDAEKIKRHIFDPFSRDEDEEDRAFQQPIINTDRLQFNPLCTGGEVAGLFNLVCQGKVKLRAELPFAWAQESEEDSIAQYPENTAGGKGVSYHLMRVGAIRGESDFVSGLSLPSHKARHFQLQLPDWAIFIEPVIEGAQPSRFEDLSNDCTEHNLDIDRPVVAKRKRNSLEDNEDDEHTSKRPRLTSEEQQKMDQVIVDLTIGEYGDAEQLEAACRDILTHDSNATEKCTQMKELYLRIENSKEAGISLEELSVSDEQRDYLRILKEKGCILELSDFKSSYLVACKHASQFMLPCSTKSGRGAPVVDETKRVPITPFVKLNGEVNTEFIVSLKHAVAELLMRKPGIPEKFLLQELDVLNRPAVLHILREMEESKLISSVEQKVSSSSIRKSPLLFDEDEEQEEFETTKCYYVTCDALFYQ